MRRFAQLFQALDASTSTTAKVDALVRYFVEAPATDAAWAVYVLAGGKPRQAVPTALLRQVAAETAGIDDWLFEASYQVAGDLAETIAHVLPPARRRSDDGLAHWIEHWLLPLRNQGATEQAAALRDAFDRLDARERFVLVKLIGGGWRVGVSRLLVQRALASAAGVEPQRIAQRLMGWTDARRRPSADDFRALVSTADSPALDAGQPFPFFLAHALTQPPETLGPVADWLVEWKYDGVRAQIVKRRGTAWIWSRGEELVTDRFPEIVAWAVALPDGTVLDGEVLAWDRDEPRPAPFQRLQRRIARKTLTKKALADTPVRFLAYDLLEAGGRDLRAEPLSTRRAALEALLPGRDLSAELRESDWAALAAHRGRARERGVEGLMLKARSSRYGSGRTKGDGAWWKWKVDPLTADGVLIYAQAGHGRRAGLYTDYTFAVWNRPPADAAEAQAVIDAIGRREPARDGALQLVPFAKAYSGLSDDEFAAVDRVIRAHTLEKFGPVRSVRPSLVFELAFEAVQASPRHKSGIAVRFPRMLRLRPDKPLHEADTLDALRGLMQT